MPRPRNSRVNFGEAIASWQLEVQTEVKRTSTLPTGMFDACDPMLEARLCEAADTMFQCLVGQEPPARVDHDHASLDLELVKPQELVELARCFATPDDKLPELEGDEDAMLGVLADACCNGDDAVRAQAGAHLARAFGVDGESDPLQLATELLERLRDVVPPGHEQELDRTCHQIAAAVLQVCLLADPEEPTT